MSRERSKEKVARNQDKWYERKVARNQGKMLARKIARKQAKRYARKGPRKQAKKCAKNQQVSIEKSKQKTRKEQNNKQRK